MKVVALISGGKDSILSMQLAMLCGHEVVASAHLAPSGGADETDSYMYQSVGSNLVDYIGRQLLTGIPHFSRQIQGSPIEISSNEYVFNPDDEVEDLYQLLKTIKCQIQNLKGVVTGAIFSTYQRKRVEDVCRRLGLHSIAPLWHWPQSFLLGHLTYFWDESEFDVRIFKVATLGLGKQDLMKSLHTMRPTLAALYRKYGMNTCGEGGEFESLVLNCPVYKQGLVLSKIDYLRNGADDVWYVKARVSTEETNNTVPANMSVSLEGNGVESPETRLKKNGKIQSFSDFLMSLKFYEADCGIDLDDWNSSFRQLTGIGCEDQGKTSDLPQYFASLKPQKPRLPSGMVFSGSVLAHANPPSEFLEDPHWELQTIQTGDSHSLWNYWNPESLETSQLWRRRDSGDTICLMADTRGYVPHEDAEVLPSGTDERRRLLLELLLCWRHVRNELQGHLRPPGTSAPVGRLQSLSATLIVAQEVEISDMEIRAFSKRFWEKNESWNFDDRESLVRWKFLIGFKDPESSRDIAESLAVSVLKGKDSAIGFNLNLVRRAPSSCSAGVCDVSFVVSGIRLSAWQ